MLAALTMFGVVAFAPIAPAQAAPPTLAVTCAVRPVVVAAGGDVQIVATGFSAQNRQMSFSFKASSGRIAVSGRSSATLHTAADSPATITVTCNVVDDHGVEASQSVAVAVQKP